MDIKTASQRAVEVKALLKKVDITTAVNNELPKDIVEVLKAIDGANIIDLLSTAELVVDKGKAEVVVYGKDKNKTMYKVFTTGDYGLTKVAQVGNRTLEAKISLFLR